MDYEPKCNFPHLSLIYLDLKGSSVENPLLETHLACKEVSNDLDYNLVLLIRRLVPGHHHLGTRQVLQLIYLQPGERKLETIGLVSTVVPSNAVTQSPNCLPFCRPSQ